MQVVLIGCGSIGQRRYRDLVELNVPVIAVADPDAYTHPVGIPFTYTDPTECLQEHAPDSMVVIASPTFYHTEQALMAIDNGCTGLLVEKPPSIDYLAAKELAEAASVMGVRAAVAFNFRYHQAAQMLKDTILYRPGVFHVLAVDDLRTWPAYIKNQDDNYLFDKEQGGVLLTASSHAVDLAIYLMGAIEIVSAYVGYNTNGVDTSMLARLVHEGGGVSVVSNRWYTNPTCMYAYTSLSDTILMDLLSERFVGKIDEMHKRMMRGFIEYVSGSEDVRVCTLEQGAEVMRILDLIRESHDTQQQFEI